jgi:hypothetical protein
MKLPINIKKKQTSMPVYAATSIIMLCIALFCLFTPFIAPFSTVLSKDMLTAYMILGGVTTMFFAFVTAYTVFSIISPPIGITVSEEGIYEYTVAGCGAGFIPKEAIVSLKTYGVDKKQYLGINVASAYVAELGEKLSAKREIMDNVDAGAPAVIIRQSDIYITVNKLLKILIDAYGTESTQPKSATAVPLKAESKAEKAFIPPVEKKPSATDKNDDVDAFLKLFEEEPAKQNAKQDAKAIADSNYNVIADTKNATDPTADSSYRNQKLYTEKNQEAAASPSVIKTVDELLAQLNIPIKPQQPKGKDGE